MCLETHHRRIPGIQRVAMERERVTLIEPRYLYLSLFLSLSLSRWRNGVIQISLFINSVPRV